MAPTTHNPTQPVPSKRGHSQRSRPDAGPVLHGLISWIALGLASWIVPGGVAWLVLEVAVEQNPLGSITIVLVASATAWKLHATSRTLTLQSCPGTRGSADLRSSMVEKSRRQRPRC